MPLRLDNAKRVAHMPTAEQQQTKKALKPRFKVDPAASPMPEPNSQNASRPGRHQIGMVGEIISEILGDIKSVHPGEIIGIRRVGDDAAETHALLRAKNVRRSNGRPWNE